MGIKLDTILRKESKDTRGKSTAIRKAMAEAREAGDLRKFYKLSHELDAVLRATLKK